MRPPLWTLLAIPVLVLLALYIYSNKNTLISQAPAPKEEERALSCAPVSKGCLHVEGTEHYKISVTYPNAVGAEQEAIEAALKEQVDIFKRDLAEMLDEAEKARLEETGRMYEFAIDYKAFTSAKYTSYEFDIYVDTGGAHPNGFYKTLVMDAGGAVIELADLFKGGSNYLGVLSAKAYEKVLGELQERVGEVTPEMEDTVRMGTAPSPEALQFFVIDGDELVLLFPPYQVAAYAAGSFEARIPLSELTEILK